MKTFVLIDQKNTVNWQGLLDRALPSEWERIYGVTDSVEFTDNFEVSRAKLFIAAAERLLLEDGDVRLIFTDLTFQHLPMYWSMLKSGGRRRNVTIDGFLHGGYYEPWDLQRSLPTYSDVEQGMLKYADNIYVQTEYHSRLLCRAYPELLPRTRVVGLPIPQKELSTPDWSDRERNLGYFSRKTPDKGIDLLDRRVQTIRCSTREAYWQELQNTKAVIVPTRKETLGYVTIEAIICGAVPIVPADLCYTEVFSAKALPQMFYYNDADSYSRAQLTLQELEDTAERKLFFDTANLFVERLRNRWAEGLFRIKNGW